MLKKIKKIAFILLISNIFCLPVFAQVFDLSSAKDASSIDSVSAEIYKPSKLIIGSSTLFAIKAKPGTHVSLLFSGNNTGIQPFYGQELRLGAIIDKIDGIVGKTGLAEIKIKLPEDKDLIGKIMYFEAVVWQKKDFSDMAKAKIIGINGQATGSNALVIAGKPKNKSIPGIGPEMGGAGNFSRTMGALSVKESSPKEYLYSDDIYYRSKPLMLRNLRAPGLNENQKKQKVNEQ